MVFATQGEHERHVNAQFRLGALLAGFLPEWPLPRTRTSNVRRRGRMAQLARADP